jgi:hypothetical protein
VLFLAQRLPVFWGSPQKRRAKRDPRQHWLLLQTLLHQRHPFWLGKYQNFQISTLLLLLQAATPASHAFPHLL